MSRVTKEQIARAKEWDLLSYLQTYEPHELRKCGPNQYCTRTHDSLKISNGKWHWYSRGIGGRTALNYLIEVRGLDFVQAVKVLCGNSPPALVQRPPPDTPKQFELPETSCCPAHVVTYLQGRGIDSEIISQCLKTGILYESRNYQNCVFVGHDLAGCARFASLRGTRGAFKLDVAGSDKRYSFCLSAGNADCPRLAVAESPIDALSLATLVKLSGGDWRDSFYLSLGGTSPRAMLQFLQDHPQINQVSLCLDNDKAGLDGIAHLEQAIRENPELSKRLKLIHSNPPSVEYGKDYNEVLCAQIQIKKNHRDIGRLAFR